MTVVQTGMHGTVTWERSGFERANTPYSLQLPLSASHGRGLVPFIYLFIY